MQQLHIHKREPTGDGCSIYVIGAFLLIGFLGTISHWDPQKFNYPAFAFILFWHGGLLYWLYQAIRREQFFSSTCVTLSLREISVDQSYTKVAQGTETMLLDEMRQVVVLDDFLAFEFPDDPKYVDYSDPADAETIIQHVLKVNPDVTVIRTTDSVTPEQP
jgi:hypothetical protein